MAKRKIRIRSGELEAWMEVTEEEEEHSNLDLFSLEMFENIAYTMAKHADPKIPDDVETKKTSPYRA